MVAELKRGRRQRRRAKHLPEKRLAPQQGDRPQVVALGVGDIEKVIGEPARGVPAQGVLERMEIGDPLGVEHHHLAVEDRGLEGQPRRGPGDALELVRPVVTVAGQEADLALAEVHHQPVAVELDLVQPVVALGRGLDRGGQLRLELVRRPALAGPGKGRRVRGRAGGGAGFPATARGAPGRTGGLRAAVGPHRLGIGGDLVERSAAGHAVRKLRQDVEGPHRARVLVTLLDQQPVLAVLPGLGGHPGEHPGPAELLPVQAELQVAAVVALDRVADRLPLSLVP